MSNNEVIINQKEHEDIYNWLSENIQHYEINENYQMIFFLTSDKRINVYSNVSLKTTVKEIKYPFRYVEGFFSCIGCNSLTSLKGSPEEVKSWFSCTKCDSLTSLMGSPQKVLSFVCRGCKNLTSLIGSPEKIPNGYFDCRGCDKLTSLIGAPKEVGGFFEFNNCDKLTSLIGFPKKIEGYITFTINDFYSINNTLNPKRYKLYLAMWLELLESVSNEERLLYITNYKNRECSFSKNPIIPIEILKEYGF